jgi:hypothetical protein
MQQQQQESSSQDLSNRFDQADHNNNCSKEDSLLLEYTDTTNPLNDGTLCDTQQYLDTSCIPDEVYSVARFHLSSTCTRRNHPNVLRTTKTNTATMTNSSSLYVVVGLGKIAVFDNINGENEFPWSSSSSYIMTTSDLVNQLYRRFMEIHRWNYHLLSTCTSTSILGWKRVGNGLDGRSIFTYAT